MNLDRVLVAVDFSPASVSATHYGRRLRRADGRLDLLHVVDAHVLSLGAAWTDPGPSALVDATASPGSVLSLREKLADIASRRLARFVAETDARGVAHASVSFGRPADEIVATCERTRPDLLVLGGRPRGALERFFAGSVAEEVARRCPSPTLIVPESSGTSAERVIVALDPSDRDAAAQVLGVGRDLARLVGAELLAIAVVPQAIPLVIPEVAAALPDFTQHGLASARQRLLELTRAAGCAEAAQVAVSGLPADEVCQVATERDVIVCGSHGRGLLGRLAFGSVSTRLLRTARCPVLVVRPEGAGGRQAGA